MGEHSDGGRARLFIAFDIPTELTAGIEAWQARALDRDTWRPVSRERLHLTLVFLGSRPEAEIAPIASLVETALPARGASLRLRPAAVGIPRRLPRALALEADAPNAADLARRLSSELDAAGLHDAESRPYWPHLTVARLRKSGRGGGPARRPKPPTRPLPRAAQAPTRLCRVVLYRSEARPDGARHLPEAEFTLAQ